MVENLLQRRLAVDSLLFHILQCMQDGEPQKPTIKGGVYSVEEQVKMSFHLFSHEFSIGSQSSAVAVGQVIDDQWKHDGLVRNGGLCLGREQVGSQALSPTIL